MDFPFSSRWSFAGNYCAGRYDAQPRSGVAHGPFSTIAMLAQP